MIQRMRTKILSLLAIAVLFAGCKKSEENRWPTYDETIYFQSIIDFKEGKLDPFEGFKVYGTFTKYESFSSNLTDETFEGYFEVVYEGQFYIVRRFNRWRAYYKDLNGKEIYTAFSIEYDYSKEPIYLDYAQLKLKGLPNGTYVPVIRLGGHNINFNEVKYNNDRYLFEEHMI